jgi:Zn-dependent metalloprotease
MHKGRCAVCFIVPPHVLKKLSKDAKSDAERDALFETLRLTENLRGRRSILARPSLGVALAATDRQVRRKVYDAHHKQLVRGNVVRVEGGPAVADTTANEAYDNVGKTFDFYLKVFERVSVDNRGAELDSFVHYGVKFDNAFWDGHEMVYGDGGQFHDFTGALDVIAHELTHGVTQFMIPPEGLEYQDQSGALNESWSDCFGSMCKQWAKNQTVDKADWLIGDTIVPSGWSALRSMSDPGSAYDGDPQPGTMGNYQQMSDDNGGVHINSGIPNHAFYLACKNLSPTGYSWEKAGRVWYQAYRYLNPTSDFVGAAKATAQAAAMLFGNASAEQQGVVDAWAKVGVAG